ncbi:hypothetical protein L1889_08565 [Paenalcaligenes niemegkensis]|nr:DUF3971 domain-containing protein [Paenalcaligenes niemegkensis]MCQ9616756.1 hypothetical protein [Paenalcaligenes niemegkensis]
MSSALGSQLSFERIEASWRGLHPSIEFSGVELRPEEMPDASLHIPLLRLKLSWSSLTARTFHFKHIEIEGLSLPVRRDEQARLHLGEIELSPAAAFADNQPVLNESEFVHWLVQQPKVSIRDATLIWEDQLRAKKPVALDKIQLSLTSTPRRYHVELHSQDDRAEQAGLLLIADFERSVSSPLNLDQAQGRVYVRAAGNGTALWNSWLPVPDDWSFYLEQAALWLDIEQGRIEALRFDTLATDVALSAGEQVITARRLDASIQGPWSSIDHWVRGEDLADTELSLDAYVEGLRLGAEPIWQHGLEVARAALSASWAGGVLQLSKAAIETADFSLTTRGTWTESADSDLGELSLHGELNALHLAHLYRYFPVLIDEDVTDWLEHSLVKGQLEQGAFVLSGDLSAFPFNAEPEKGYFYVGGNIRNASVDYLPAEAGEVSWPPVSGANGYLYLERAGLYADFDQGQIEIDPARPVQASRIKVSIPDMESEATLVIQAQTAALASDYLALMTRSPLGGLLNHSLDEAKAQGRWQVPLQLTVPLHNPNAISLQGHIAMSESTLQLFPDFPLITKLSGQLEFDETGVGSDDLKGEWLGQAITLRDKLAIGEKGLSIEGTLDVAQLKSYVQQELLERFSGTAAFLVNMRIADEGQLLIDSFSTLEGLALSLPEPFIKTAAQQWPLKLAWMPAANGNDYRLMMKLGETLQAEFIQDRASAASGFHTGAITTKDELRLPEEGLRVDLRYPRLDLDDWYALISSLRSRQDRDQGSGWPSLTSLRLQSEQSLMLGLPFSQLTVTAQRPAYKRWRVDLSSTEVAGSIQWAVDANGDIDGLLDAHLQRLVLWEPALESEIKKHEPAEDAEDLFDGDLQLPELAIRIDHLRVAGLSLGSSTLSVIALRIKTAGCLIPCIWMLRAFAWKDAEHGV